MQFDKHIQVCKQHIQNKLVIKMEQNNILLDESVSDGSYQLRLKLKYLQQDKQKLQISCKQMAQNISLLRQINKEIAKGTQACDKANLIGSLSQQNNKLETSYLRLVQQNHALSCQNLILQQIIHESQKQYQQILNNYESKIMELRASVRFKQSCIQTYEHSTNFSNNSSYEIGNIPPSNVSMVFFAQIDGHKATIQELGKRNKQLDLKVKATQQANAKLQEQKLLIDNLLRSRCGYQQLKERLKQGDGEKRPSSHSTQWVVLSAELRRQVGLTEVKSRGGKTQVNSELRKQTGTVAKSRQESLKQTMMSTQAQQTRQIWYQQSSGGNFKFTQLKQELKRKNTQVERLALAYRSQNKKRKQQQQKMKALISSNQLYREKREGNADQLNYYKTANKDLLRLVERKRLKRDCSLEKTQTYKLIQSFTRQRQAKADHVGKGYLKKLHQQVNSLFLSRPLNLGSSHSRPLKRSLSDILTYTNNLCNSGESLSKHLDIKKTCKVQSRSAFNKKDSQKQALNCSDLNDFSRVLCQATASGQLFNDQTLIIKPKSMTYAQKKKLKAKTLPQSDASDITIIRENILWID